MAVMIAGPDGFLRAVDVTDAPWLIKACYHEAGSSPARAFEWGAVLWTLTNRWAGRYARPGETLGEYAQRFCQPINPAQVGVVLWYDKTDADPTGISAASARWARIRANRARSIACYVSGGSGCGGVQPAPELVAYVARFLRGEILDPRYVALTDWAATYAGHGPEDVRVDLPVANNAFYRETWTAGWTSHTVRFVGVSGRRPWLGLSLSLGLGIAVAGGIILWRGRRV